MPFITTPVDGGLDLVTPPISVRPGRLQDCENFEVALNQGVRSIDGYERFDGGVSPSSSARLWKGYISTLVDATLKGYLSAGTFVGGYLTLTYSYQGTRFLTVSGQIVATTYDGGSTGEVFFVTGSSADSEIVMNLMLGSSTGYVWTNSNSGIPGQVQFVNGATNGLYAIPSLEVYSGYLSTQEKLDAQAIYYAAIRAEIQEVPGQGNVLGLFWLKDELYACRDYLTLAYGTSTSIPSYNNELFIGASYAAATWKGFLAKNSVLSSDPVTGDSGVMMFYNTTGTATTGTLKNHSASDVAVATVTAVNVAAEGAGLYRADGTRGSTVATQSWTHQEIGYHVRYKDDLIEFVPANRVSATTDISSLIQSTDFRAANFTKTMSPAPGGWTVVGGGGSPPSTNAVALQTDDGDTSYFYHSYTAVASSNIFWNYDFGFDDTDIPDGSTITGFTVEIVHRGNLTGTSTGTLVDNQIELKFPAGSGVIGTGSFGNTTLAWTNALPYQTVQYGGEQSLLGYRNVSADSIKSSDFGFSMSVVCSPFGAGTGVVEARITSVGIQVHYLPPQSKIYFWNGTSAVIGEVVSSYKTSGTVGAVGPNNAKGHLFLMAVGTNRQVGADEQIRTMPPNNASPAGPGDGSSLIATTENAMTKNVMDWSSLLSRGGTQPNNSKYEYVTSNFYAKADFDAIYGVSGAGPAFMYDGYAFTRIYTGTPEADDIPRHVSVHQSRMFLGYQSGSVQFSVAGNPLSFDPLAFAGEIGVGSAVRGLMELNGDTMAELTQKGVSMIQGDVGLSPYPGVISPDVGCVEYSAQSMGQFMYTSFRGVQNLRATQAYGDFDTSQFSWDVWSWLRPRVQTSAFFESANIGVINSLGVRNKSQYRLMFADGKQLSATFLREGEMPQYTIQQYYHADGTTPLTWDVVTAGTESNGRDRLFGATNDGTGYVYEIDRGYSFDGGLIEGFCVLSVMDQGSPQQYKEFTDYQVYGLATDYAIFTVSRAVGYGAPNPSKSYTHTFGSLTAVPTGSEGYATSAAPIRDAGRNITLRYDFSSSTQPPFTIQAISYNIVPGGEKRT